MAGGGRGLLGEAGLREFFYYESKFKIKKIFFWGGVWRRGATRVIEFFHKDSKCKKKKKKGGAGEGVGMRLGGGGRDGRMDSLTGPNQFLPSTSSKLGE